MAGLTRDGVAAIHVLRLGSRKDTVSLDSLNLHEAHADFRKTNLTLPQMTCKMPQVYTQESALYSMLNKILRSRGEERKTALSPFMQYHKLLMTALGQVRGDKY